MPSTYRLLITPAWDGAKNMAVDEAILHALADGKGKPTLRFYQWNPPCLSLGFGQRYREVDESACKKLGYSIVRRPTGGRAILHKNEFTYSFITSQNDTIVAGDILKSYRHLSQGLLLGLKKLGVDAVQAKGNMPKNHHQGAACFDTPSHYEVTTNGKKLIGSAQLRRRGIVLQHGTLPLFGDITDIFDLLSYTHAEKSTMRKDLSAHATTLESLFHERISFENVANCMQHGFTESLNLSFIHAPLNKHETFLAKRFHDEQYAHDDWNKRRM